MVRLTVALCTWRRDALLELVLERVNAWRGVDLSVVVCGSEDSAGSVSLRCGALYTHAENRPLSGKFNHLMRAVKTQRPDYVLVWADDAIATDGVLSVYMPLMEQGVDAAGWDTIWYWDQGRAYQFSGYTNGRTDPVGVGRLLSARAMDLVQWRPWVGAGEHGLDLAAYQATRGQGVRWHGVEPGQERIVNVVVPGAVTGLDGFRPGEIVGADDDEAVSILGDVVSARLMQSNQCVAGQAKS